MKETAKLMNGLLAWYEEVQVKSSLRLSIIEKVETTRVGSSEKNLHANSDQFRVGQLDLKEVVCVSYYSCIYPKRLVSTRL